jgi:hypothetical protein
MWQEMLHCTELIFGNTPDPSGWPERYWGLLNADRFLSA